MPVAHIVLWKLKNKDEATLNIFKPLHALNGPTKLSLGEPLRPEKSGVYNYGLYSTFENLDALNAYIVDPEHVKIVEQIKPLVETAVAYDVEI